jgi:hypothetical protein
MSTQHVAVAPVIGTLAALARWTPQNATEYARIMDGLRDIAAELAAALHALSRTAFGLAGLTPEQSALIAEHLDHAAQIIGATASGWLDAAHQATGTEWQR